MLILWILVLDEPLVSAKSDQGAYVSVGVLGSDHIHSIVVRALGANARILAECVDGSSCDIDPADGLSINSGGSSGASDGQYSDKKHIYLKRVSEPIEVIIEVDDCREHDSFHRFDVFVATPREVFQQSILYEDAVTGESDPASLMESKGFFYENKCDMLKEIARATGVSDPTGLVRFEGTDKLRAKWTITLSKSGEIGGLALQDEMSPSRTADMLAKLWPPINCKIL